MLRLTSQAAPALLCVQRERVQQEGPCQQLANQGPQQGVLGGRQGGQGPV